VVVGIKTAEALDFDTALAPGLWRSTAQYYSEMPGATRAAVGSVVTADVALRKELRERYLPELLESGDIIAWGSANHRLLEQARERLYSGNVVAADDTLARYESLSMVGAQVAISRVSYGGLTGQIAANLTHWGRELSYQASASEIVAALRSRSRALKDALPKLLLLCLMLYKERELLLDTPPGTFKMIQGPLLPQELLSGAGREAVLERCLELVGRLIDDGDYANIVSEDTHLELVALGSALEPGEFLVIDTGVEALAAFRRRASFPHASLPEYGGRCQGQLFDSFVREYGPRVVRGVLRAHVQAKPYVFYCNRERVQDAVHVLLADAANTGPRGFPLLLDLADQYCSGAFGAGEYACHLDAEFVRASDTAMYLPERWSRDYQQRPYGQGVQP
jgi:hypothetical protein